MIVATLPYFLMWTHYESGEQMLGQSWVCCILTRCVPYSRQMFLQGLKLIHMIYNIYIYKLQMIYITFVCNLQCILYIIHSYAKYIFFLWSFTSSKFYESVLTSSLCIFNIYFSCIIVTVDRELECKLNLCMFFSW